MFSKSTALLTGRLALATALALAFALYGSVPIGRCAVHAFMSLPAAGYIHSTEGAEHRHSIVLVFNSTLTFGRFDWQSKR